MRKLMLLVEQANTHTQEDLEKQLVTLIRDYLAHEDNEDTSNSEWLEDHMDYLIKKNPELSQLVKTHNLDDKVTNRKWLNAVFMKHMGKTIKEFETLAQDYLDQ
jgi:phage terminase large subunit GpA-like protein